MIDLSRKVKKIRQVKETSIEPKTGEIKYTDHDPMLETIIGRQKILNPPAHIGSRKWKPLFGATYKK